MDSFANREKTLDPQDWEAIRGLGRRMVDDMLSWLETVRERKVWQPVPTAVKAHLQQPLPSARASRRRQSARICANILPYPIRATCIHASGVG